MQEVLIKFVHEAIKCGWGITMPKRNQQKLLMSFICEEIHARNFHLLHLDLVASPEKIKFNEETWHHETLLIDQQ